MGIPLTARSQVKGVLELYHRQPLDQDTDWWNFLDNLARQTATNQPVAAPLPKPKRSLLQRVTGIFGDGSSGKSKAEARLSKTNREALGQATPELMEELLAEKVAITDEEFRQLMTLRARWVQDWLVQTGQVAGDRLLLVAPNPVDAAYRGESRVNLSLN